MIHLIDGDGGLFHGKGYPLEYKHAFALEQLGAKLPLPPLLSTG